MQMLMEEHQEQIRWFCFQHILVSFPTQTACHESKQGFNKKTESISGIVQIQTTRLEFTHAVLLKHAESEAPVNFASAVWILLVRSNTIN